MSRARRQDGAQLSSSTRQNDARCPRTADQRARAYASETPLTFLLRFQRAFRRRRRSTARGRAHRSGHIKIGRATLKNPGTARRGRSSSRRRSIARSVGRAVSRRGVVSFLRAGVERIGGDVDARRGAARRGAHGERTDGTGAGAVGRRAGAVEGGDRVVFAGAGEEFVEAAARARGARGGRRCVSQR